jgi:hypothetical protein
MTRDLAGLRQEAQLKGFTVRAINLYCDTLVIEQDSKIAAEKVSGKDQWYTVRVFARKIDAKSSLSVSFIAQTELLIYTPGIGNMLKLQLILPNGQVKEVSPTIEAEKFGIRYGLNDAGNDFEIEQLAPPRAQIQNINYLDLINEDGTLRSREFMNE